MAHPYIINFIQSLNKIEITTVEEYLRYSTSARGQLREKKDVKLFRLLITNKNKKVPDTKLCKELNCNNPALRVLKSRLYRKVSEALISDKNTTDTEMFDNYDITVFTLKKKLLFFKVSLRSQNEGKIEAMYELLNEVIESAKKYELYDILVEALTAKKYFKGVRSGIKHFDQINDRIIFYDYCLKATLFANDCYYRIVLNNDFIKSLSQKELDKYIRTSIKQMESDYKKTKSEHINYYLHIIYFALCEREKKYLDAIRYCNKIITMLKKSKVIYRKERMGFALINISQFKTFIGDYEAAAIDAKNAQGRI